MSEVICNPRLLYTMYWPMATSRPTAHRLWVTYVAAKVSTCPLQSVHVLFSQYMHVLFSQYMIVLFRELQYTRPCVFHFSYFSLSYLPQMSRVL